ncbi:flagellar basal-body rod protein FlgB [Solimonas aquatica]|uniref:Flagellar basal body rod protein FlgB n=1 Tax=Solimonas aquatica TaxID=489703 RepID=A0A1H9E0E3_9GAMM|nr:flagellar basal body rod protein FlgB [Solimonas aquatica]SEQ19171.1 flagellar basal-body rod protein FlgB [Solimonas aquatica]
MAITDPLFGIQEPALQVQRRRLELIAANIANADTPGFEARDVDFRSVLAQAQTQLDKANAHNGKLIASTNSNLVADTQPIWRLATQPSEDGNTVDTQVEQAQFADAALRYQASLNFIDGRVKSLLSAITGQ